MQQSSKKKPTVLCINPWIYDFTAYDLWSKPLGLLYVASYLRERGVDVDLIDCLDRFHPALLKFQGKEKAKERRYGIGPFHDEQVDTPKSINFIPRKFSRYGLPEEVFRNELKNRSKPDAILLTSAMTYWYPGPVLAAEICREVYPDVPLLFGGIYASLMPDHAKQVIKPDYLVTGPGEIAAADILSDVLKLPHLREEHPTNIDDFPYPAFDLYPHLGYLVAMSSRGCPFRCTFCATYKIDAAFSQRDPDAVAEELIGQSERFKVQDIAFYDDALLLQPKLRIKPLLYKLKESKRSLRFHTPNGLHARFVDEELAQLFYDCGFKTVRLSLESVAKERMRDIHNKITPGEMTRAVKNLVKAGYKPSDIETYIIMALPGQLDEEVIETILYANSLGIRIRLASFSPIPGTVDFDRSIERGLLPENPDPLLTNKTVIPIYRTREAYERFHAISQLTHMLNEGAGRGITFFNPSSLQDSLFKALDRVKAWEN
ncbi:MAG: B12-binding domain-containing radical SAM protein [Calditrichia bacterium]